MPPTAHAQLNVRVFVEEQTSLSVAQVNSSFKKIEQEHNIFEPLTLGDVELSWFAESNNGGTFVKGFDILFKNNNTVPLLFIAGIIDAVDSFIVNNEPFDDTISIGEPESESSIKKDLDDDVEDEATPADITKDTFKIISTDEDILYSCSAKGDFADFNRPLFNEFVGIGTIGEVGNETMRSKSSMIEDTVDFPVFLDTVQSDLYDIPTIFLNTQDNVMSGEKANILMNLIGTEPELGLSLVGKISRRR